MSRRLLSFLLIISILMSSSLITSVDAESRASDYFISYSATLFPGSSPGALTLVTQGTVLCVARNSSVLSGNDENSV